MIVSLALGGAFSASESSYPPADPSRIASQVVSGIGFLGAGAIIRQGLNIKGLTTAATIWLSAAVGLACGAGEFFPAAVALLIALCTLIIMEKIEEKIFPAKKIKTLNLICERETFNLAKIQDILSENKVIVDNVDMSVAKGSSRIKVFFQIHIPNFLDTAAFCATLEQTAFVAKIELTSSEKLR